MKKIIVSINFIILAFLLVGCKLERTIIINEEPVIKDILMIGDESTISLDDSSYNNVLLKSLLYTNEINEYIPYKLEFDNDNLLWTNKDYMFRDNGEVRYPYNSHLDEEYMFEATSLGKTRAYYVKKYKLVTSKLFLGEYIITDYNYSNFIEIKSANDFYKKIESDINGNFILAADIDFSNIAFRSIEEFNGAIINPYKYKIKNITNGNGALIKKFSGYINGLIFEDCNYEITQNLYMLFEENINFNGHISNIHFNNCNININASLNQNILIDLGQAMFVSKCSFEGKIFSPTADVTFRFFGNDYLEDNTLNQYSLMENSYCILDLNECKGNNIYKIISGNYSSTYNVIKGNVDFQLGGVCDRYSNYLNINDIELDSLEFYEKYGLFRFISLENLLSGNKISGLNEYIFVEGQYPKI